MDADFVPSSAVTPRNYRHMKTLKQRKSASFISKTSENSAPANIYGGGRGLLFAPPPPQLCPPMFNRLFHPQNQQPPLLPLPLIHQSSLPSIQNRGNFNSSSYSYPHPHPLGFRKTRDQSLTPKKPKKLTSKNKREESSSSPKKELKITRSTSEFATMESTTDPLGPDPNEVHKEISDKLLISSSSDALELDKHSGSVFSLSPPPSSLPLPKFSVRPCKAEAGGGIDAGATDNLRRILRLR